MINFIRAVGFLLVYATYTIYSAHIYVYIIHLIIFLKSEPMESLRLYL